MVAWRRRLRWRLAVAVVLPLAVLAGLGDVLMTDLVRVGGANAGDPAARMAALHAAEWVLALGALCVTALAWMWLWRSLEVLAIAPLEGAHQQLRADPNVATLTAADDPVGVLRTAHQTYRRLLQLERQQRSAEREAWQALRGAADGILDQLREADRLALVGRVALGVAHEIGGPLAIVGAYLDRLDMLGGPLADPAEVQRCLHEVRHASERIARILQELSDPALRRSDEPDRPCDAIAVCLRVVQHAALHPQLRQLDIELQASAPQHAVDAAAAALEQVLLNLLLNAAEAMQGCGRVRLHLHRDGSMQHLTVDDNGPGIAPQDREQVFTPFYTTKTSEVARQGWGLGLAVSRRVVERYGGTLTVAAADDGGARFEVRLPAADPHPRGDADAPTGREPQIPR